MDFHRHSAGMPSKNKWLFLLLLSFGIFTLAVLLSTSPFEKEWVRSLLIALMFMLTSGSILFWVWRNQALAKQESDKSYLQLAAHQSVVDYLHPRLPLPAMRSWAISPDLARYIIEHIDQEKPKTILEIGTGVSTLVSAYCLEKLGGGKLISVDNNRKYAEQWKTKIKNHGLEELAEIRVCPFKNFDFEMGSWKWYDLDVKDLPMIDFLFVDAPYYHLQKNARYPALLLLAEKLNSGATVLLDDAFRSDVRWVMEEWKKEFPGWSVEMVDLEKGACLMRKP